MELIVDLHTHSHFSRATSKEATIEGLYKWGKIKGIDVIGTGDFTHPGWFAEIRDKLEPAEPGLFSLKAELAKEIDTQLPTKISSRQIRFILTVEISNIYSKNDKIRKLHHLIIAPSFAAVSQINSKLDRIGNLKSDGRPILGLDSKELLKIVLDSDKDNFFIPAHIWTPWFSLFGSKSGFNSIREAFEELSSEIKAIETGLSSDPYMNWRVKELENITIISNSDAHSPQKLGREATLLNCQLNYLDIINGMKTNDKRIVGTIEFFPQEGKYHYDGHKNCSVCFAPLETKKHQGICPVCHKPLTIGVDYRVDELSYLPPGYIPKKHKKVEYIIPLIEIIAEIKNVGTSSNKVQSVYDNLIATFGSEFEILRGLSLDKLTKLGYQDIAFGLEKMRHSEVLIEPGYDGVFGKIKIFDKNKRQEISGQKSLF